MQNNGDADDLARKGPSIPFHGSEPADSNLSFVGKLKIKEWLKNRHSKNWTAAPGMIQ